MIDYSETTLAVKTGMKELDNLLLKRQWTNSTAKVDDIIVALIDLKWWLKKQNENN